MTYLSKEILDLHTIDADSPIRLKYPSKRWMPYFIAWNPIDGNRDFTDYKQALIWSQKH